MPDNTPTDNKIPYGYCRCGCGQKTKIAPKNNFSLGHIKDKPYRFIKGHHNRLRPWGDAEQRFWEKVDKDGPIHPVLKTRCWLWAASRTSYGYGQFWTGKERDSSHRFAYFLSHGAIPDGMLVCHKCDNPSCVNPNHLFLGTPGDNTADMIKKGRNNPNPKTGRDHPSAKLGPDRVKQIRLRYKNGEKAKDLAKEYRVCTANIYHIVKRKSWKHI